MTNQTFKNDIKILVIGDSFTGKTCFTHKWTKGIFEPNYKATIVSEFGYKIYEEEGNLYRIQLWNIAGQDKDFKLTKIFSKNALGCIILADATNIQTREE